MARYRIVCTEQEPVTEPTTHAHIVAVGTGTDPDKADKRWTLNEVLTAMDKADTFYTQGQTSGRVAEVEKIRLPAMPEDMDSLDAGRCYRQ